MIAASCHAVAVRLALGFIAAGYAVRAVRPTGFVLVRGTETLVIKVGG